MENLNIKSIDVQAKEWFDKANGNSYFSAIITLNNGLMDSVSIPLPFQYGYESHFEYVALEKLNKDGYLIATSLIELREYCKINNISLFFSKKENCTIKETKDFVK